MTDGTADPDDPHAGKPFEVVREAKAQEPARECEGAEKEVMDDWSPDAAPTQKSKVAPRPLTRPPSKAVERCA